MCGYERVDSLPRNVRASSTPRTQSTTATITTWHAWTRARALQCKRSATAVDIFGPLETLPLLCTTESTPCATDRSNVGCRLDRAKIVARQANSNRRAMCPFVWMRCMTCGESRLCHKHVVRPEALPMPNNCGRGTARLGSWHRYRKRRAKYGHMGSTVRCASTWSRVAATWTCSIANPKTATRYGRTAPKPAHPCYGRDQQQAVTALSRASPCLASTTRCPLSRPSRKMHQYYSNTSRWLMCRSEVYCVVVGAGLCGA